MGVQMSFSSFATAVREHLWVLEVEPAYSLSERVARFMWSPYGADLEPLDSKNVRFLLSAHGELVRTIDLPMTQESVRQVADGIIAVFEPDTP
jgi:hypothetical protein